MFTDTKLHCDLCFSVCVYIYIYIYVCVCVCVDTILINRN